MDLGLDGKCVQSTLIEYSVRMQLSDVYFVVIESPLTLELNGESISLSPEEDSEEAFAPVRQLVGLSIAEATADKTGLLRVLFNDGTRLEVQPDEHYEAWSVSGPDGALVVCTPGGKLAIWSASGDANT